MVAYHRKKATAVLFILYIYAKITDRWLIFIEWYYFPDVVKIRLSRKNKDATKENTP